MLLTGSIRENIALGRADVDETEMLRASKVSMAHDFISTFPAGCDLRLADRGEGLSGGHRQSIAMGRALAGRPLILITHRPTLLALVNRVILLSRGRIVMDGTPEQITGRVREIAPAR